MKSVLSTNKKRLASPTLSNSISRPKAVSSSRSTAGRSSRTKLSLVVRSLKRFIKQGIRSMLLSSFFHKTFTFLCISLVVGFTLYSSYRFIGKTFANEVIVSQSEIIARINKLVLLPQEPPDKIVRVQDPEDLKQQNAFYRDIEEGDYILMYKNVAVIYRFRDNVIVSIKRIEPTVQSQNN